MMVIFIITKDMEKESKFIRMEQLNASRFIYIPCHLAGMVTAMKGNGYRTRGKAKECTGQQMVASMMYV